VTGDFEGGGGGLVLLLEIFLGLVEKDEAGGDGAE
jgi:hypothetical protein